MLFRCVPQHLETWLAQCRDGHDDEWPVPEYVEREFRRHLGWQIAQTAERLGISRKNLWEKMRKLGIAAPEVG